MGRFPIASLIVAALIGTGCEAAAQSAAPASPLGRTGPTQWPAVNARSPIAIPPQSAIPSGEAPNTPAAFPQCRRYDLTVLRNDVERKRELVDAAIMRRASSDDVCKLLGDYRSSVRRMIGFAENNGAACGTPAFADKLKIGLKTIEDRRAYVCSGRLWPEDRPMRGPTGDFYPVRLLDAPDGRMMRAPAGPPANVLGKPRN